MYAVSLLLLFTFIQLTVNYFVYRSYVEMFYANEILTREREQFSKTLDVLPEAVFIARINVAEASTGHLTFELEFLNKKLRSLIS